MKNIIFFSALFISCLIIACSNSVSPKKTTPQPEIVKKTIGASGGRLSSGYGTWSLTIPAGALASDTEISIATDVTSPGNIEDGYLKAGTIYKMEPHGLTFAVPATLSIFYAQGAMVEEGIEEKTIAFYYINDNSTITEAPSTLDYGTNTLKAQLSHFSFGGPLVIGIRLVNNGVFTDPAIVDLIADRLVAEMAALPDDAAREAFLQENADLLAPFLTIVVEITGSNPVADTFPNVEFTDPGYPQPVEAVLFSTPQTYTNSTAVAITVGGTNVVTYKYNLDAAGWSAETPIATPIAASGLAEGTHTVQVTGKASDGTW